MSAEQLQAFWEAVDGDTSLQEKLSSTTDGDIDTLIEAAAVVAIAKEAGFTITAGDILKVTAQAILIHSENKTMAKQDAQVILELSDEDLEMVAGGLCGIPGTAGQPLGQLVKHGAAGGTKVGNNMVKITCSNGKSETVPMDQWKAALAQASRMRS
jgi:predicted ribosomally synthesized peptide with nif11-like leader